MKMMPPVIIIARSATMTTMRMVVVMYVCVKIYD